MKLKPNGMPNMLASDRTEFDSQLATLCAGYNVPVGLRSEAYWLGLSKMELHTFIRIVEHCLGEDGPEKFPTARECWAISKNLRAARYVPPVSTAPKWQGDKWDIDANHHLLQHIRNHPKKYAPDSGYDPKSHHATPGPLTEAYTEILVRWKKTWSEDMRAEKDPSAQVAWDAWCDCMQRADEQIAQLEVA